MPEMFGAVQALKVAGGDAEHNAVRHFGRLNDERRRTALQARLKALQAEFDAEVQTVEMEIEQAKLREQREEAERARLSQSRMNEANSITLVVIPPSNAAPPTARMFLPLAVRTTLPSTTRFRQVPL